MRSATRKNIAACAMIALARVAVCQTDNWTRTTNGKWETALNWDQGAPSINLSASIISNANTKTITFDAMTIGLFPGTTTISNLTISGPAGTVNTLQLTNAGTVTPLHISNLLTLTSGGALLISNSAVQLDQLIRGSNVVDGTLTLLDGVLAAASATTVIGSANGSNGGLLISGGNAVLSNLTVGLIPGATGSVTVTSGTLLVTNLTTTIGAAGIGQMTVSGGLVSNRLVNIGRGISTMLNTTGVGTLTVSGGTFSVAPTTLFMGIGSGTTGTVWVTGGSLIASNNTTDIAVSGVGQMTVSNGAVELRNVILGQLAALPNPVGTLSVAGGTVHALSLSIGSAGSTTGAVWITGGSLSVTNSATSEVDIGLGGNGQMAISNGAFTTRSLVVGVNGTGENVLRIAGGSTSVLSNLLVSFGTTGTVWVTGGQLLMPTCSVTNAFFGIGQITVSNGTVIAHDVTMAVNPLSQGRLTIAGGSFTALGDLIVGDCATNAIGTVVVSGGTLFVTNAAHTAFLDLRNGTLTVSGTGLLVADRVVMTNACGLFVRNGGSVSIGAVTLDPNLSAVGDGIRNGWKQQYGLDPFDPNLGNEDADGDGMSNLQEFLAGTDPTNSSSSFRITGVAGTGNNVLVTWVTGIGKTNALQAAAGGSYTTNGFTDIFTVTNISGTVTNYLDVGGLTNKPTRYYRVRLVP